jgi:hypothetical protein
MGLLMHSYTIYHYLPMQSYNIIGILIMKSNKNLIYLPL